MKLSEGAIQKIKAGDLADEAVNVKVTEIKQIKGDRFECTLSDGKTSISAVTARGVAPKFTAGEIRDGSIIEMTDYACQHVNDVYKIVITGCRPLAEPPVKEEPKQEPIKIEAKENEPKTNQADANPGTPATKKPRLVPESMGGSGSEKSSVLKTPAAQIKGSFTSGQLNTPGPTPSPFLNKGASSASKPCQPIHALNPYSNDWTIKARVVNKAPLRHFEKGGTQQAVFSIEVVDDQGTTIEITLWRNFAEKFYDHIEEGQVYYFKKGNVKLANKNFQNVRNDYIIHMDNGSDIEQCAGQDVSKMQARLKYVDFEQLPHYAGKKMLVDVLGLVTAVGPLGSVKRSADGSELARRDVTIVDASLKTVGVTLWGATAEELGSRLEQEADAIISISSCRVTDFNGVSLSTVMRSNVQMNPEGEKAEALRQWWESEGRTMPTHHLGEGLMSANKRGNAPAERLTLAQLQLPKEELPPADAKPLWHTVVATVASIDPAQNLYYEACPDNNRKVVKQGDGWYCEYDSKLYPDMVRRYVMLARFIDSTGECLMSVFNEHAEQMLGMTADEIAVFKEGSHPAKYECVIKRAQWAEWIMRVQSRTQEYNGELRQRISVASLKPVVYAEEVRRLLQDIQKLQVA